MLIADCQVIPAITGVVNSWVIVGWQYLIKLYRGVLFAIGYKFVVKRKATSLTNVICVFKKSNRVININIPVGGMTCPELSR